MSIRLSRLSPAFGVRLVLVAVCIAIATLPFAGCERKERVLDVETPGADVEVDRNVDTGEVDVSVEDN
jgi:hypothetical protein